MIFKPARRHAVSMLLAALAFGAVAETAAADFITIPDGTNAARFRLYTNAAPTAVHLFNTFDLEFKGEVLLESPAVGNGPGTNGPVTQPAWHSVVVNGAGPELAAGNSIRIIEQASGPEWHYVGFDATAAYRGRVE